MPDGSVADAAGARTSGAPSCPGAPQCAGAPPDYVVALRLGGVRRPAGVRARGLARDVADQQAGARVGADGLRWRGPHRVRCEACADARRAATQGAGTSRRASMRARLVQAARYRPSRACDWWGRICSRIRRRRSLIYDAVRLFPHVEVAGEASAVVDWSDLDLRRMKDLRRIDVALYGPDAATHDAHCGIPGAFAAMLRACRAPAPADRDPGRRLRDPARRASGRRPSPRPGSAAPCRASRAFACRPSGASLDELAQLRARAAAGRGARGAAGASCRAALCEREGLPPSSDGAAGRRSAAAQRRRFDCGRSVPYRPCGSDPIGAFETCWRAPSRARLRLSRNGGRVAEHSEVKAMDGERLTASETPDAGARARRQRQEALGASGDGVQQPLRLLSGHRHAAQRVHSRRGRPPRDHARARAAATRTR